MSGVIYIIISAAAFLSHPILMLTEDRRGRKYRLFHVILAVTGAVVLAVDSFLFFYRIKNVADTDLHDWAVEFFRGCAGASTILIAVPCILLIISAAAGSKMIKIRRALLIAVSFFTLLAVSFAASVTSGGQFPLDVYVKWLAPGQVLIMHAVSAMDR